MKLEVKSNVTIAKFINVLSAYPEDYTLFGTAFNDFELLLVDLADRDAYSIDYNTGWSPYYFEYLATSNNERLTVRQAIDMFTSNKRYKNILDKSHLRKTYNVLKYDVIDESARHYPEVDAVLPADAERSSLLLFYETIEPYLKLDTPINSYKTREPSFQPKDPDANKIKLNYTLNELIYLAIHGVLPDSYYERYAKAVEEQLKNH